MKLVQRVPDKGYLDTWLWVPKHMVNVEGVKNALTFTFIDSYEKEPRVLELYKETVHHLLVPRAFWEPKVMPCEVVDCRPTSYTKTGIRSRILLDHRYTDGTLKPTGSDVQKKALDALIGSASGVLQLACGRGKTVIFLELAVRMQVPTLIIIDNTHLLEQWRGEVLLHLDLREEDIGLIQGSEFDWKKPIVLATYHTIANRAANFPEHVRRWFGLIGWDEGHHIGAPTFARGADLFYGKRIALTATPVRDDGLHVIYDMHIGSVIYKDLSQDLKPAIVFKQTGLKPDESQPDVDIRTRNRDIHLSKVYSYFGRWRTRLDMVLDDLRTAYPKRDKILVLSNSVAEVVNLAALWTFGPDAFLYSDIPEPLPEHVGETLPPVQLTKTALGELELLVESAEMQINSKGLNPIQEQNLRKAVAEAKVRIRKHRIWEKIQAYLARLQKWYIKELLPFLPKEIGIMTFKVPSKLRFSYVKNRKVIFSIAKYGKEGLDASDLDTVLVCEPFSQRNIMQQVMGRAVRLHEGKKSPVVLIYEDEIPQIIGMCQKLRKHLREWPHEEGGPFDYEIRDKYQW